MLRTGETFAGYVIKRVLGQGGMGTVYLAQHPRLPRLTALKLLERDLYSDVEMRTRFEREADLVAQLDHPNIVTVYDRGAEDEQLWISMQFVAGSDAASADVNVLAPWRAVQIIAETAAALDFAHANRVLHRDVKPANILLAKAPIGQPERVLLTDFGIAGMRDSDTTLSSAGTITATLAYAAPEQLSGQPLDHRVDQYSLACTLFWMLTGTAPFNGTSPATVMNGHLYGQVPSLRPLRPDIPPALDGVLARAMAKRAADRFPTCTDFAMAARRALAPPEPRRPPVAPGPLYRPVRTGQPQAIHPRPGGYPYVPDGVPPAAHPRQGRPVPVRPSPPSVPSQPRASQPPVSPLPPTSLPPTSLPPTSLPPTSQPRIPGSAARPPGPVPPNPVRPPHGPVPPYGSGPYRSSGSAHPVVPPAPGGPVQGPGAYHPGGTSRGAEAPQQGGVPPRSAPRWPQPQSRTPASGRSRVPEQPADPPRPEPSNKRRPGRPITIALPDAVVRRVRPRGTGAEGGQPTTEARPPP